MNGTVFSLDNRLALCASFVREGTRLVDVGTDVNKPCSLSNERSAKRQPIIKTEHSTVHFHTTKIIYLRYAR